MSTLTALVFPHQLYNDHPALQGAKQVVVVEDPLLFREYRFHRQKLMFHRASMKHWTNAVTNHKLSVHYIAAHELNTTADLAMWLKRKKISVVQYVDPCDDWLATRLRQGLEGQGIRATVLEDPAFLTPMEFICEFTAEKRKLFFTEFYIAQRRRLKILLEKDGKPTGGQWSFDPDNRKKLPKTMLIPPDVAPAEDTFAVEACRYVEQFFPNALGDRATLGFPSDRKGALAWLDEFIQQRLPTFGDYEDAISMSHRRLFHSVLAPMLNVGLLTPREVIDAALHNRQRVPLNSLEGFVRQIIGWREFVRLVYLVHGRRQRSLNFWNFRQKMPAAFYDGTTGIPPVDHVIRQVLKTGYCHHIERLMILGNFFLLCEIDPDDVYQWFMELFIDAYDWVMVPNVYGMSQHADGGLMTTKPYISGSSYVLKMSDFKKGSWCGVWDALYWRFVDRHVQFFARNPRMGMMVKIKDKLGSRLAEHHKTANDFLSRLGRKGVRY